MESLMRFLEGITVILMLFLIFYIFSLTLNTKNIEKELINKPTLDNAFNIKCLEKNNTNHRHKEYKWN